MVADDVTLASWREALAEQPVGWDFSDLGGYAEEDTPWRFETVARNLAQVSHHLLDIGTGGGESLAALGDALPDDTVATETRPDSLAVARRRLEPLGVEVVEHDPTAPGATLPFAAGRFDLVLARHARFDAREIERVLAPGGIVATQQVGGDDMAEILAAFGLEQPFPDVTLENLERELTSAGLRIERSDAFRGRATFHDMGSLLRFLRRVPWIAPADLGVDSHRDELEELARRIADGTLTVSTSRFWILARAAEATAPAVTDFSQLLGDTPEVPAV